MGRDDYAGLSAVSDRFLRSFLADAGMGKSAAYMKDFSTGYMAADMALGFTPVMSGYDAVKNFWNTGQDLKNGKYLSALGNLGSGVLNTGLTALDFLTMGGGGTLVRGAGKLLGRALGKGGKVLRSARLANAANRVQRGANAFYNAERAARVGLAGRIGGSGARKLYEMSLLHGMQVDPRAALALTSGGKGMARVGGWVARHPIWSVTLGGQAAGMMGSSGDGPPDAVEHAESPRQISRYARYPVRQMAFGPGSQSYGYGWASGHAAPYRSAIYPNSSWGQYGSAYGTGGFGRRYGY